MYGKWISLCKRRFLHNHGDIATEGTPRSGMPDFYRITSRVLFSSQSEIEWIGLYATFVHIQAELGQENLLMIVRWHCPLDTWFEIRTLDIWGRGRYLSVTEAPHNTEFYEWMGKKCFFQTAETGKATLNSIAWKAAVLITTLGTPHF